MPLSQVPTEDDDGINSDARKEDGARPEVEWKGEVAVFDPVAVNKEGQGDVRPGRKQGERNQDEQAAAP